ncbi:hypothetical protein B7486_72685, partial [cyanobacterium TDX16]
ETGSVLETFVLSHPIAYVRVSSDGSRALVSLLTSPGSPVRGLTGFMVDTTDGSSTTVDDAAAAWSVSVLPPYLYSESGPGRTAIPDADGSHVLFTSDEDLGGANPDEVRHLWTLDVAAGTFERATAAGPSVIRDGALTLSADGSTAFGPGAGQDRSIAVDLASGAIDEVPLGGPLSADETARIVASGRSARLFDRQDDRMVAIVGEG